MIHDEILNHVLAHMHEALIDDVHLDDPTRAGVVILGFLQDDPDPDEARISVTIFENDPDYLTGGGTTAMRGTWDDEVVEVECGGAVTYRRCFTIKARCLLVDTAEDLQEARQIASTVRSRIEQVLINLSYTDVSDENEYVSMVTRYVKGEMLQAGGPEAYDYHIKVRFSVLTTTGVNP